MENPSKCACLDAYRTLSILLVAQHSSNMVPELMENIVELFIQNYVPKQKS